MFKKYLFSLVFFSCVSLFGVEQTLQEDPQSLLQKIKQQASKKRSGEEQQIFFVSDRRLDEYNISR